MYTQDQLQEMPLTQLLTIHNDLSPKPVKKFSDKKVAVKRILSLLADEEAAFLGMNAGGEALPTEEVDADIAEPVHPDLIVHSAPSAPAKKVYTRIPGHEGYYARLRAMFKKVGDKHTTDEIKAHMEGVDWKSITVGFSKDRQRGRMSVVRQVVDGQVWWVREA